ncbi:hypothetical protein MHYP_G00222080 [Metynnis hypsauchen]
MVSKHLTVKKLWFSPSILAHKSKASVALLLIALLPREWTAWQRPSAHPHQEEPNRGATSQMAPLALMGKLLSIAVSFHQQHCG